MAAIPAESSQPGHNRFRSGGSSGDSFWSALVLFAFAFAVYWLARSSLKLAGNGSGGPDLFELASFVVALVFVLAALALYSRHPRTRSSVATFSFTVMKTIMLLAGIVLFVEGLTSSINTDEFSQQAALALLALFYVVTPLILHFGKR